MDGNNANDRSVPDPAAKGPQLQATPQAVPLPATPGQQVVASEPLNPLVVIVDRNMKRVEIISRVAVREECSPQHMQESLDVFDKINRIHPCAVFLSYDMRGVDVLDLCKKISAANMAVVLHGAFTSPSQIIMACQHGAYDFLAEPLREENVTPKVINVLAFAKLVLRRKVEFVARNTDAGTARLPVQERLKRIMDQVKKTMAMPQTTEKLLQLCDQPNVTAKTLAEHIRVDPGIAGLVYRRANSAVYGTVERAQTLSACIIRLGNSMVRSLVALMTVFKMCSAKDTSFAFSRVACWVHGLCVGILSQALAARRKDVDPDNAFLGGVLHDLGRLILDEYVQEDYLGVMQAAQQKACSLWAAEKDILGQTHADVGYQVAEHWKLPKDICAAIRDHHSDATTRAASLEKGEGRVTITDIVYMANHIAQALLIDRNGGDQADYRVNPSLWKALRMSEVDLRQFTQDAREKLAQLLRSLNVKAEAVMMPAPPLPANSWVQVRDAGQADFLLDVFFSNRGARVVHSDKAEGEGTPPCLVVWDMRTQAAGELADQLATVRKDVPQLLVHPDPSGLPRDVTKEFVKVQSPFNYTVFFEAVEKCLQSSAK